MPVSNRYLSVLYLLSKLAFEISLRNLYQFLDTTGPVSTDPDIRELDFRVVVAIDNPLVAMLVRNLARCFGC
jgi:hypothetical protein